MQQQRLYDNFGHDKADRDMARWTGVDDEMFVETPAIRDFLTRDPDYPFLVGTKGAGKSILLFKKAVQVRKLSGVMVLPEPRHAYEPSFDFAEQVKWNGFWQLQNEATGAPNLERWGGLWEWALLKTILKAWQLHAQKEGYNDDLLQPLITLVGGEKTRNPYHYIAQFLAEVSAGGRLTRGKLTLPRADEMRRYLVENARSFPPVYLFLDNQDDYFDQNPEYWIGSGCGSFLAIQRIHSNTRHRVHCFATLRPEVVWVLKKTPHWPMYQADIFTLHWNDAALRKMLNRRAERLKDERLREPALRDTDPLLAFLGRDKYGLPSKRYAFRNHLVEVEEPVYEEAIDYIFRHTLRRPREMILLGNHILAGRRDAPADADDERVIREAVDSVASDVIATGYLAEVAHRWPWPNDGQTSLEYFITHYIRHNVLSRADVYRIREAFAAAVGQPLAEVFPFSVLASFGLIGWPVRQVDGTVVQHFLMPGAETTSVIPGEVKWLLVHPILYSAPFHLEAVRGVVIGPGLPFTEPAMKNRGISLEPMDPASDPGEHLTTAPAPLRVLHLSDLHFSARRAWDQDPVLRQLARSVEVLGVRGLAPDLVAISGDIASTAAQDEYEAAAAWIREELLPACRLTEREVLLVPGNHDVDRREVRLLARSAQDSLLKARSQDAIADLLGDPQEAEVMHRRHRNWLEFAAGFGPLETPSAEPWWSATFDVGFWKVHFAGFCSTWMSCSDDDHGKLLLGRWQVNRLLEGAENADVVISMMHHPWDYLADFDRLEVKDAIARQSTLVLAGHLHQQAGEQRARPAHGVVELAAGACYETGVYPNAYQLIEVDPDSARVWVHHQTWLAGGWIVDRNACGGTAPTGVAEYSLQPSTAPK